VIRGGAHPAPAPAPAPLAVFQDVAYCDTRYEHEITMVSDGRTAYAAGDTTGCGPANRYDTTLVVTCNQPHQEAGPCDGRVEFNLDTAGTWTADPVARRLLAEHGEAVEA
jgi:hypothetical protein